MQPSWLAQLGAFCINLNAGMSVSYASELVSNSC